MVAWIFPGDLLMGVPCPRTRRHAGDGSIRKWQAAVAFVLVSMVALQAYTLYEQRQSALSRGAQSAANLAMAVTQDVYRNFELYDLSMQAAVQGVEQPAVNALPPDLRRMVLFDGALRAEHFGSVSIVDAGGHVTLDSRGTVDTTDYTTFPFFRAVRDNPNGDLYISRPFYDPVGGDLRIALSRRVSAPGGAFAGIVKGTIELGYFRDLFARFAMGKDGTVTLLNSDGIILSRRPYVASDIGRDVSMGDIFPKMRAMGSGLIEGEARLMGGEERLFAFNKVGDLPLYVSVALSRAELLAPWWSRTFLLGSIMLVLCAAASTLAVLLTRELSRRVVAERRARQSESLYRLLAENSNDTIMHCTVDGVRDYLSPGITSLLGYTPEDLVGRPLTLFMRPQDRAAADAAIDDLHAGAQQATTLVQCQRKDGAWIWVEMLTRRVEAVEGRLTGFVSNLRDVTWRKKAEDEVGALVSKLQIAASTDPLTGLANRRIFAERSEAEWRRGARSGTPLCLLLVDADRFKAFNDTYGHLAGDSVLATIAETIGLAAIRSGDLCARYGGEEFVVLLPDTDAAGGGVVAERVRACLRGRMIRHAKNECGFVTVSIGVAAVVPNLDDSIESLLACADRALYAAKDAGRDCVVIDTNEPPPLVRTRLIA